MRELRIQVKRDARRALVGAWGKAIAVLLILLGIGGFFAMLDRGAQSLLGIPRLVEPLTIEDFLWQVQQTPVLLIVASSIIFVMRWILTAPLEIGINGWYLGLTDGQSDPISEIFAPFGGKLFTRSLWYSIVIGFLSLFWSVLFTGLPAAALGYGIYSAGYMEQAPASAGIALMCIILGSVLLLLSMILLAVFLQRYLLAPYLLTSRYEMTVFQALKTSKKYTKGRLWELFTLGLSFIPWVLLCCLIVPIFYVAPYIQTTYAIYARYLIESGKREELPFTREFNTEELQ